MPATAQPAQAPTVFSTAGLPAARRVELWESHNAAALIGLDVHAPGPLEATELNVQLPQARLARVSGSAHTVERSADVIARSPADSVAIYLTLRGDAWFTADGRTLARRPGDALVCATDRPFARGFARGLEELVVTVPCSALTARSSATRLEAPVLTSFASARPPSGPGQYARALARITSRATRTQRPLPPDERTILDLVTVLVSGQHAALAAAHRAAAHCYIEEHLTDASLGAPQIAAAAGLSERQLSRLFAIDGTSVPRHVLTRRLQLAYSVLSAQAGPIPAGTAPATPAAATAPANPDTIADIAARCGFTSVAYFSHAFRRHFGVRATDVRRDSQPPHVTRPEP
jgi:AraC-like DNA-binding protein